MALTDLKAESPLIVLVLPRSRSDRQLRGAAEAHHRPAESRLSAACEGGAEEKGTGELWGVGVATPTPPLQCPVLPRDPHGADTVLDRGERHSQIHEWDFYSSRFGFGAL